MKKAVAKVDSTTRHARDIDLVLVVVIVAAA
jgi:hypothetical protein